MSPFIAKWIVFLACHAGVVDHYLPYIELLESQGYQVDVYAAGPALKKFSERHFKVSHPFSLENLSLEQQDDLAKGIAKASDSASLFFTDVGDSFDTKVQAALAAYASEVKRIAYYENLEPFVPGGYSATAFKVMEKAQEILFANKRLETSELYFEEGKEIDFKGKRRWGVGFYPTTPAETILRRRHLERGDFRRELFKKKGLKDCGQTILVYFGGNNEEYFSKAFPAFLSFLPSSLDNAILLVQQHPGAKGANRDRLQLQQWLDKRNNPLDSHQIIVSELSSDDAQVLADIALYYQTSMGSQFLLENIFPVQIGHQTYSDILVRNGLAPSVTCSAEFLSQLKNFQKEGENREENSKMLRDLILKANWQENFLSIIERVSTK